MKYTQNTPYVPPSSWRRGAAPCTCSECPDCDSPTPIESGTYLMDVDDNGICFSGDGIMVTMPDITTVTTGFCISFKGGIMAPATFYTYESFDGGGVHFVIDNVEYDVVGVASPGGELCICYADSTHWLVTGDASGHGGGPG